MSFLARFAMLVLVSMFVTISSATASELLCRVAFGQQTILEEQALNALKAAGYDTSLPREELKKQVVQKGDSQAYVNLIFLRYPEKALNTLNMFQRAMASLTRGLMVGLMSLDDKAIPRLHALGGHKIPGLENDLVPLMMRFMDRPMDSTEFRDADKAVKAYMDYFMNQANALLDTADDGFESGQKLLELEPYLEGPNRLRDSDFVEKIQVGSRIIERSKTQTIYFTNYRGGVRLKEKEPMVFPGLDHLRRYKKMLKQKQKRSFADTKMERWMRDSELYDLMYNHAIVYQRLRYIRDEIQLGLGRVRDPAKKAYLEVRLKEVSALIIASQEGTLGMDAFIARGDMLRLIQREEVKAQLAHFLSSQKALADAIRDQEDEDFEEVFKRMNTSNRLLKGFQPVFRVVREVTKVARWALLPVVASVSVFIAAQTHHLVLEKGAFAVWYADQMFAVDEGVRQLGHTAKELECFSAIREFSAGVCFLEATQAYIRPDVVRARTGDYPVKSQVQLEKKIDGYIDSLIQGREDYQVAQATAMILGSIDRVFENRAEDQFLKSLVERFPVEERSKASNLFSMLFNTEDALVTNRLFEKIGSELGVDGVKVWGFYKENLDKMITHYKNTYSQSPEVHQFLDEVFLAKGGSAPTQAAN